VCGFFVFFLAKLFVEVAEWVGGGEPCGFATWPQFSVKPDIQVELSDKGRERNDD